MMRRNLDQLQPHQAAQLQRYHRRLVRQGGGGRGQWLARAALRVVRWAWFRYRLQGQLPDGAFIVLFNHVGPLDALAGEPIATWRRPRFAIMAMARLFVRRPLGEALVRAGFFPVQRGQRDQQALETARGILRAGGRLALAPEGQWVPGPELGPFRPGAAQLALQTDVPLVPVYLCGVEQWRRAWWPWRVRLGARIGLPLWPRPDEDADALTRRAREAMLALQEAGR